MTSEIASQAGMASETDEGDTPPSEWREWLETLFPSYVGEGFAGRHERFWEWLWAIGEDDDPKPYVGIWPRGGGKTTSAELGTCALGVRGRCSYAVYVQKTQDDANDRISNMKKMLESGPVSRFYPDHSEPDTGKFGNKTGWRRERLRTAGGFTVDALGLDAAARGSKLDEHRPDLLILDDLDHKHDSGDATRKKLATLKDSILQMIADSGSVVIGIQNLIHPNGIFARLEDGRADFLQRRVVDGPHPAIEGLETERKEIDGNYRDVIVGGSPTWEGQDVDDCQARIEKSGLESFRKECQNEIEDREGALWSQDCLTEVRVSPMETPQMVRVVVGVDPAGGTDEVGIVVAGKSAEGRAYVLGDYSMGSGDPYAWGQQVRKAYHKHEADAVVVEDNYGGQMVDSTVRGPSQAQINIERVNATHGKRVRAEPVAGLFGDKEVDWQDTQVKMAGRYHALEKQMTSWVPEDSDSPDRLDALVWTMQDLLLSDEESKKPQLVI